MVVHWCPYSRAKAWQSNCYYTGERLLLNFRPYAPRSNQPRAHDSPAHRLNGKRYHEHWLHNLMASTSLMGLRNRQPAIR